MDLGLEGRVALVIGGTRGIGRGIAQALAAEGARVALTGTSAAGAREAAAAIGGETVGLEADTEDLEGLRELPGAASARLGAPVEILVTNTGGPPPGPALDAPAAEWERAYRNLVTAPRVLIEAVLPAMREGRWGRIVNVGSSSTEEIIPHLALSNVHRMAAVGLFKTLARELAAEGITLNTIATGKFATDRLASTAGSLEAAEAAAREEVPAGRLGRPAEYGDLVAFVCSERAAYLTGAVIPLDGGLLRVP